MTPALAADPTLQIQGVDWRACTRPGLVHVADARRADLFHDGTFDLVVSISAIEHVGLGHYSDDPADADGDTVVMQNILRWLKPGGLLYFDVPYRPQGYQVIGTKCRAYDHAALSRRLLQGFAVEWLGYSLIDPIALMPKPYLSTGEYDYVACWARKA